jgi:hypothetical protein
MKVMDLIKQLERLPAGSDLSITLLDEQGCFTARVEVQYVEELEEEGLEGVVDSAIYCDLEPYWATKIAEKVKAAKPKRKVVKKK